VVSHGIAFALLVSAGMTVAGYFSIDFIFSQLGAERRRAPPGRGLHAHLVYRRGDHVPADDGQWGIISAGDSQAASGS
jgi:hypothetical protein